MDYDVRYSPEAEVHLAALSANERRKVLDEVDQQLMSEPTVPTRKRKKLRQNALADWELRIGDLRVYYSVAETPAQTVSVIAVGRKLRNKVFIGGVEMRI